MNQANLLSHLKTRKNLYANAYRSHHCGELRENHNGEKVTLSGWVHSVRDHGHILFVMLRDQYGLTQLVASADGDPALHKQTEELRLETTICVTGTVRARSTETINENLLTGHIELELEKITVLSASAPLPFEINQDSPVKDESIEYRYLYLRRPSVKDVFIKRSAMTLLIREFLTEKGFLEIETPLLTKTTPEGARDFLVPSRVFPGEFYALPQSPQQYKQLLMVSGVDKYFQIARALRDEDSRADRQAEHTQIDMEMAFIKRDNVIDLLEKLIHHLHENLFTDVTLPEKVFPRISYHDCMEKYGSDKPDIRFDLQLHNVTAAFEKTEFRIFQNILGKQGRICALKIPGQAKETRKNLDNLINLAVKEDLKGLIWAVPPQTDGEKWHASSGKVISDDEFDRVSKILENDKNDLILIAGDNNTQALLESLGRLRAVVAEQYKLIPPNTVRFAFVVDYPLLHWNADEKRYDPLHHMFVRPKDEDLHLLDTAPEKVISTQFDLVANGYELCSGSERIHTPDLQRRIMRLIGLSDEEITSKFSHLLRAFDYGAPPHGGAAPGLDRILMVFLGITSIREVIAFPKTQRGQDLMMGSPSPADTKQLADLALSIDYTQMKEERVEYLKQAKTFEEKTF